MTGTAGVAITREVCEAAVALIIQHFTTRKEDQIIMEIDCMIKEPLQMLDLSVGVTVKECEGVRRVVDEHQRCDLEIIFLPEGCAKSKQIGTGAGGPSF